MFIITLFYFVITKPEPNAMIHHHQAHQHHLCLDYLDMRNIPRLHPQDNRPHREGLHHQKRGVGHLVFGLQCHSFGVFVIAQCAVCKVR